MKIAETDKTVTTLDVSARFARNVYGGSPLMIQAVIATTERGTYHAGPPNHKTRRAHREALEKIGWGDLSYKLDESITHGVKTVVDLDAAPGAWPRKLKPEVAG